MVVWLRYILLFSLSLSQAEQKEKTMSFIVATNIVASYTNWKATDWNADCSTQKAFVGLGCCVDVQNEKFFFKGGLKYVILKPESQGSRLANGGWNLIIKRRLAYVPASF